MGSFSVIHWAIVLLVVMLLFGGGRVSGLMGDVAKGIKSFKKGLASDDDLPASQTAEETKRVEQANTADQPVAARAEQKMMES